MKTKFGLFSRGQKCEMCKQIVCHRCYTKVKNMLYNTRRFIRSLTSMIVSVRS